MTCWNMKKYMVNPDSITTGRPQRSLMPAIGKSNP